MRSVWPPRDEGRACPSPCIAHVHRRRVSGSSPAATAASRPRSHHTRISFCLLLGLAFLSLLPRPLDAQSRRTPRDGWQRVDAIFEALGVREGDHIADIGAGRGFFTFRLSPRVGPTGRVIAVDIDGEALEDLQDEASRAGFGNIETVVSEPYDPMLPPESVDGVLIVHAYHEMREYEAMLAGIRRALRPDGRLVIVDNPPRYPRQSRRRQTQQHDIAMEIVVDELEAAGFHVIRQDATFVEDPRADQEDWLVVAVVSHAPTPPRR